MIGDAAFRFSHALARRPSPVVVNGLRAGAGPDPDFAVFSAQHDAYRKALTDAGVAVTTLPADNAHPDAVFVEDAALMIAGQAIILKPGAVSRRGEAARMAEDAAGHVDGVIHLTDDGRVDGGDILVTGREALIGLSERTDTAGANAVGAVLAALGVASRRLATPAAVLHFKSDCGLLDGDTVFATERLAASGCFAGYDVVTAPAGEEAAANLVRVNDHVLLASGFPRSAEMLDRLGYRVKLIDIGEAAKIDGGLSCMSLRYTRQEAP